ncbi:hypothetical protein [Rhodopirellula baltica]
MDTRKRSELGLTLPSHLILRTRPDVVASWSELAGNFGTLFGNVAWRPKQVGRNDRVEPHVGESL